MFRKVFTFTTVAALGIAGFAASSPPAAGESAPSPVKTVDTLRGTPAKHREQTTFKHWTITLAPTSASAKAIKTAKARVDARSVLSAGLAKGLETAASSKGAKITRAKAHAHNRVSLKLDKPLTRTQAKALMVNSEVTAIEPDVTVRPTSVPSSPNDPFFNYQWAMTGAFGHHANTQWPSVDGTGVRVAVIDTGYVDHPDLPGLDGTGYDFITEDDVARDATPGRDSDAHDTGDWTEVTNECGDGQDPAESSWHGTHVASVIGARANDNVGIAGVAPQSTIVPIRALGHCGGLSSDISDGITWASGGSVPGVPNISAPAKVINLSLGGYSPSCPASDQAAIDAARARGSIIVVAAGNENMNAAYSTPANCKGVITVAAIGEMGQRSYFSNYGVNVTLSAQGGDYTQGKAIIGAIDMGTRGPTAPGLATMQGTSQATPQVAGTIALMLQANPRLTADQVKNLLQSSARRIPDTTIGAGVLDAAAAVKLAKGIPSPLVSGKGKVRMYGADSNGNLQLFSGDLGGMYWNGEKAASIDWNGITYLAQINSIAGDGNRDLIVRQKSDNSLWLYTQDSSGGVAPFRRIGQNWGGMDQIVPAFNLGGGTTQYVVARNKYDGTLWRYTLTPNGLTNTVRIGYSWNGMRQIIGVGDFNNDGRGDIMGLAYDGRLWFYRGTAAATIGEGTQAGSGWSAFQTVFSPGDMTGSGRMTLAGLRSDGYVFAYENRGGYWGRATIVQSGLVNYKLFA